LHRFALDAFLAYKQNLIDYLQRFIGELMVATVEIAGQLLAIESHGVDRLLSTAAQRDLADSFNIQEHDRVAALADWRDRWHGLRAWFISEAEQPSQADVLRSRARSAVPALVNAVANIHDRRVNRSDRVQDLRTLARWFAQAENEQQAHRLWRAAFALTPSRHLQVNDDTLDARDAHPVSAMTSWLDAPPVEVAPRLRKVGRIAPRGPAKAIVDRSKDKAILATAMADEAEQIRAARQRMATGRSVRLSEMGFLREPEFALLLELLDEALTRKVRRDDVIETESSDGTLLIRLWPADGPATIDTETGSFSGQDYFLLIRDALLDEERPSENRDQDERKEVEDSVQREDELNGSRSFVGAT